MSKTPIQVVVSFLFLLFTSCGLLDIFSGSTDECPTDPNKTEPGECGCGVAEGTCSPDQDSDHDGTPDKDDPCSLDPNKIQPGLCGCNVSDIDSDHDNTPDCMDHCKDDPNKIEPGVCGCGKPEDSCSPNNNPIITASGDNAAQGEGKEKAFDGDANTKWLTLNNTSDPNNPVWIQYEFGGSVAKVIKAYSLTSASDHAERDPRNWKLLGSNNSASWTTLDERSNDCFQTRLLKKVYKTTNNTAYMMYRLEIVSNNNPATSNSTQLAEIELLETNSTGIDPGVAGDCNQGGGTGIRFAAYGDTRTDAGMHQTIINKISALNPELVLHTGDLWDGYSASQWKTIVTSKSNINSLLSNNLFLVARGNHEANGDVTSFSPSIVRNNSVTYSVKQGNVFFVSVGLDPGGAISFLTNALKSADAQSATWKVVFGHYPVYSAGEHGSSGISAVESVFDQYGVDLYFAGHDHHYERTHQIYNRSNVDTDNDLVAGAGTVYFVSGGGGAPLYSVNPQSWTHTSQSTNHYLEIVTSATQLVIKAFNKSGTQIDSFTISQ